MSETSFGASDAPPLSVLGLQKTRQLVHIISEHMLLDSCFAALAMGRAYNVVLPQAASIILTFEVPDPVVSIQLQARLCPHNNFACSLWRLECSFASASHLTKGAQTHVSSTVVASEAMGSPPFCCRLLLMSPVDGGPSASTTIE